MKICMFSISPLSGEKTGGNKRFLELYQHLKLKGYQVDIFCGNTKEEYINNHMNGIPLKIRELNQSIINIPAFRIYKTNREIYRYIKTQNYDCVIAFDVPSIIGLCWSNINNIAYFIRQDFVGYRSIQYRERGMSGLKKNAILMLACIMEGLCVYRSKILVSQCKYDLNKMARRHVFLNRKISHSSYIQINNVNPTWIVEESEIESANPVKYGSDILYIGGFSDERKGYKLFLDAISSGNHSITDYKIILLGNGKHLDECIGLFKKYPNISFMGYVDNPSLYIRNTKLVVAPSLADSCPNTILEALYLNIPVIGSFASGIPEILNNKEWTFEPEPGALADKITEFLSGDLEKVKREQSIRAKELTFDWGSAVENLILSCGEQ